MSFDNLHNHGDTRRGFLRLDRVSPTRVGLAAPDRQRRPDGPRRAQPPVPGGGRPGPARSPRPTGTSTSATSTISRRNGRPRRPGLRPRQPAASSTRRRATRRSRPLRTARSTTRGSTVALSERHRRSTRSRSGCRPSGSRSTSSFQLRHHRSRLQRPAVATDYNPNLAPYDLTRGGSPFVFSGSSDRHVLAGYVQDNIRWNGPDGRTSACATTTTTSSDSETSSSRGSASPTSSRRRRPSSAPPTTGCSSRPSTRTSCSPRRPQAAALVPPDVQAVEPARRRRSSSTVSERHNAYNVGVQQGIGSQAAARRLASGSGRSTNAADQDQFFNTGIVFPLNFKGADLHGWNARLDLAPVPDGLRGYLSLGHVRGDLRAALRRRALPRLRGARHAHRRPLRHRPRPEPPGAGRALLGHRRRAASGPGVTQRYDSGLVTDAGALADVLSSPDTAYAAPYIRFNEDPQRVASRTVWSFSLGARLQPLRRARSRSSSTSSTPSTRRASTTSSRSSAGRT